MAKPKKPKISRDEPQAKCIKCLGWTPLDEYLANDCYCTPCATKEEEFPMASGNHFKSWSYQDRAKVNNESN